MMSMNCRSCGESNQIESFLMAAQQHCSHCGHLLMGDSLAQPATPDSKPWERLDEAPAQVSAGTRNITIKAIASINFFFGALYFICGLLASLGSSLISNAMPKSGRHDPVFEQNIMVMNIAAAIMVLQGMPMVLAGFGLLQRAAWGRSLALALAGTSALLSVVGIVLPLMYHGRPDICSIILHGSYSGITFFVLLQPEVAAEFGSGPFKGADDAGGPGSEGTGEAAQQRE